MADQPEHAAITAWLDALRAAGKASTAITNGRFLAKFTAWLAQSGSADSAVDLLAVTPDVLTRYQIWLADVCRRADGKPLAVTTQATAVIILCSFYRWLTRRGVLLVNPARDLTPRKAPPTLVVRKDHLSLQEAQALIDTLAALVTEAASGTVARALAERNLAAIALALATGRRCAGLCSLRVSDLDAERNELRVAHEKGRMGRVLPVAAWAMAAAMRYVAGARGMLLGADADVAATTSPWLFVSQRADRLCERGFANVLDVAIAETVRRNPDLADLATRRITTHSLRVSFATVLFANGCGIRALNELMLHQALTTTARYTPIPIEDLRRVLLASHPRA